MSVASFSLLDPLVRMVLAAERAELFQLQPLGRSFLVLHAGVVLAFTLSALKCDLFSCHALPQFFYSASAPEAHWPPRKGLTPQSPTPFPRPPFDRLRESRTASLYPWRPA